MRAIRSAYRACGRNADREERLWQRQEELWEREMQRWDAERQAWAKREEYLINQIAGLQALVMRRVALLDVHASPRRRLIDAQEDIFCHAGALVHKSAERGA